MNAQISEPQISALKAVISLIGDTRQSYTAMGGHGIDLEDGIRSLRTLLNHDRSPQELTAAFVTEVRSLEARLDGGASDPAIYIKTVLYSQIAAILAAIFPSLQFDDSVLYSGHTAFGTSSLSEKRSAMHKTLILIGSTKKPQFAWYTSAITSTSFQYGEGPGAVVCALCERVIHSGDPSFATLYAYGKGGAAHVCPECTVIYPDRETLDKNVLVLKEYDASPGRDTAVCTDGWAFYQILESESDNFTEDMEDCPCCGKPFNPDASSYLDRCWNGENCPNCGADWEKIAIAAGPECAMDGCHNHPRYLDFEDDEGSRFCREHLVLASDL